jgi:hypothetical protein
MSISRLGPPPPVRVPPFYFSEDITYAVLYGETFSINYRNAIGLQPLSSQSTFRVLGHIFIKSVFIFKLKVQIHRIPSYG